METKIAQACRGYPVMHKNIYLVYIFLINIYSKILNFEHVELVIFPYKIYLFVSLRCALHLKLYTNTL